MFRVALLMASPGGVPAVKVIPKLQVPVPAARVTVPIPVWPLVGKLQLDPTVGAAKEKLAAFVPVMLCAVMFSSAPPGLVMLTFITAVVAARLTGPSTIGEGLTIASALGFVLIVKENENEGVGPPPGSGLVIVTLTSPAVVRSEAGTGTLKPVPPPVTVPPVSGTLLKVTEVPLTKFVPVKTRVTGV